MEHEKSKSIESLDDVACVIVEREIEVHGKKRTVHVREIPSIEAEQLFDILLEDGSGKVDPEKGKTLRSRTIAMCICKKDGSPIGTVEEIRKKIGPAMANTLRDLAMKVNSLTPDAVRQAAKNSSTTDESATS
jgi:hypothetical protein